MADLLRNQVAKDLRKSKLQGSRLTDRRGGGRTETGWEAGRWSGGLWEDERPKRCLKRLEISSLLENEGHEWKGCN